MNEDPGKPAGGVVFATLMPHAPVLVPEVGGERLREVAATVRSMRQAGARLVACRPDALVVISPHAPRRLNAWGFWGGDSMCGGLGQFGARSEPFALPTDRELAAALEKEARAAGLRMWTIREQPLDHGSVVPLWFVVEAQWQGPTLGLSVGSEEGFEDMGAAIRSAAAHTGKRVVILASGDMSHCLLPGAPAGYDPRGREFDEIFIDLLREGAYRQVASLEPDLQDGAAEDVMPATLVALGAIGWANDGHEVLSYEGPFGVGYGVAILFDPKDSGSGTRESAAEMRLPDESRCKPHLPAAELLIRIARDSVTAALGEGTQKAPEPACDYLRQARGVFVTLRDLAGDLRGCVGSISSYCPDLAGEIWRIARQAALYDSRFLPLMAAELPQVRFEVSVLYPPEEVSSDKDLDPARYGVIVTTKDGRRGVLLPAIAELKTVDQQLRCARKKAGIGWWEKVQLARFEVDKFEEE
jgi:AmmeMemoRadiSam system protein A